MTPPPHPQLLFAIIEKRKIELLRVCCVIYNFLYLHVSPCTCVCKCHVSECV